MASELKTYQINWRNGKIENVEADGVAIPYSPGEGSYFLYAFGDRHGKGHFRFFKEFVLVLSAAESEVVSVRLIEKPASPSGLVKKRFDNGYIEMEQRFLDRAKALITAHGRWSGEVPLLLAREMGVDHHRNHKPFEIIVVAARELREEETKPTKKLMVDGKETDVEVRWFERARALVRQHGTLSNQPALILTRELGTSPHSIGLPYSLMCFVQRELAEEERNRRK